MTANFGRDLSCREDLDPTMREVEGLEVLTEAAHRRLRTRRGRLLDEETYGIDLVDLLNAELTPDELAQVPGLAAGELLKDERVQAVTGAMTTDAAGGVALTLVGESAAGPFDMTMAIAELAARGAL